MMCLVARTGKTWARCCVPLLVPVIAVAQVPTTEYAARRAALLAAIDSGVVIAFGAPVVTVDWPNFFQLPAFQYLTGFAEPDAVLVMVKRSGAVTQAMFVPARDAGVERYVGRRTGPESLEGKIGIAGRELARLRPTLDSLANAGLPFYVVPDMPSGTWYATPDSLTRGARLLGQVREAHRGLVIHAIDSTVSRLRARKSPAEIALLRRAVGISSRAQVEAMKATGPGCGEYEIQALVEGAFRRLGGDRPGYGSKVASGPNTMILHYDENNRVMRDGELLLIDAGASFKHYIGDVSRTFPVNGRFTPAQREIYQLVRDAQETFVRQIKPGASLAVVTDSARQLVNRGLLRLGLIESLTAIFDAPEWYPCAKDGCPQRSLYTWHGFGGHGIGLEVHDPAQYDSEPNAFQAGDVFAVEPGLYFSPEFLADLPDTPRNRAMLARIAPAFERFKGIGIKIEDNYALTDNGLEWLSKDVPREIAEVEALMQQPLDCGIEG